MTFPEDTNELRREIFDTARRLGKLKQELARRQREATAEANARFQKELLKALHDSEFQMPHQDPDQFFA